MTMLDWILIALGAIIVIPILAFLCMRSGVVGFYRGKEVWKRKNKFDSVQNNDNEIEN